MTTPNNSGDEEVYVYGFAGSSSVVITTASGSVAELTIPSDTSTETRDFMRAAHMFSPVKMIVVNGANGTMMWSPRSQTFQCLSAIVKPPQ